MVGNIVERLKSVVDGPPKEREQSLYEFANCLVFVPITRSVSESDAQGTKRVQIVSDTIDGRKQVSVFSDEELFQNWSGDRGYQCFTLAAGDLALTLPKDSTMRLDAQSANEVILNSDDVQFLAFPPPPPKAEERPKAEVVKHQPEQKLQYEPKAAEPVNEEPEYFAESAAEEADHEQAEKFTATTKRERAPLPDMNKISNMLIDLFDRFPAVQEAYLTPTDQAHPGCMLGLLSRKMSSEERFSLIESVANISRATFGEAGAIEVYDDLHAPSSRSWELFNTLAPFFSSNTENPSTVGILMDLEQIAEEEQDSNDEKSSLWKTLRSGKSFPFRIRS